MPRIDRATAQPATTRSKASASVGATEPQAREAATLGTDKVSLGAGGPAPRDVHDFTRFLEDQNKNGVTNGCGTTSLAMILSAWKDQPGAYTREKIDASIRRFNLPTSPQNIVGYAERQGFRAVAQNNGSVADLKKFIDQGVPVQIMFDPDGDGSDSILHYVVVTDYEADEKGNVKSLTIANPWGGEIESVPVDEFKARWDKLELLGHATGLNNLMIPMVPKENVAIKGKDGQVRMSNDIALPRGGNLGWRIGVTDKLFDAANGISKAASAVASAPKKIWHALTSL